MPKMSFLKIRLKHQRLAEKLKSKEKNTKRRLICDTCENKFSTWWEIWEHWKSTGHKLPECCRWCSKKTFTLQSHLCKQHWQLATMCRFCGQLFMFAEDNERHQLSHDGATFRCYHCGRRRRTEALLRQHVLAHYKDDRYGCDVCEKRFKKKKNLDRHLKNVHCICQYCGKEVGTYAELKKHVKTHDDLLCVHCNKVFSQKTKLKYHFQRMHSHQDTYKCDKCSQKFAIKSRLADHVSLVHRGECNFRCEFCQKPFLYKQLYLNHVDSVHVKSMPDDSFICRHCGFSTGRKIKLQWHLEGTSSLGFRCGMCQTTLDCKGLYDKHIAAHAAEGRLLFVCEVCKTNYSSQATLRHHISSVHPEILMAQKFRVFHCLHQGCERYYVTKSSLARHVRRVHAEIEIPKPKVLPIDRLRLVNREESKIESESLTDGRKEKKRSQTGTTKTKNLLVEISKEESEVSIYYCNICQRSWSRGEKSFKQHIASHGKEVWQAECEVCQQILESPEEAVRHYVEAHWDAEYVS